MLRLDVETFLARAEKLTPLDIRPADDFERSHIPGSFSLPFLIDLKTIRHAYGTGKEISDEVLLGHTEYFDSTIRSLASRLGDNPALAYCVNGGLRSLYFDRLTRRHGIPVIFLEGGYRRYIDYRRSVLDAPVPLVLIAGYTGSRKTEVLRELSRLGKQTIDLERLADHRGSVFGDIGCGTQPSFGQFANMLCGRLRSTNTKQPVFIEAKGEKLGSVVIPPPIFKKMKSCTSITLAVPASRRLDTVRSRYRNADMDDLCRRIIKIHRRLGTTAAKSAIGALNAGDVHAALEILMRYYDGVYDSAWGGRAGPTFYSRTGDPAELAEKILLTLTDTDIRPV